MMDKLELLTLAGRALYGARWQTPLAADLGVSSRTVRNWIAGVSIPDDICMRLLPIIQDHLITLSKVKWTVDAARDDFLGGPPPR
jgi:hypothetical protein